MCLSLLICDDFMNFNEPEAWLCHHDLYDENGTIVCSKNTFYDIVTFVSWGNNSRNEPLTFDDDFFSVVATGNMAASRCMIAWIYAV